MNNREQCITYFNKDIKKRRLVIILLLCGLIGVVIWGLAVGGSSVRLDKVFQAIGDKITGQETISETDSYIATAIRIPRVLVAVGAGAALGLSGLLMQGIFQNPLVSPYTLGISNGASFGACLAIVLSSSISIPLGMYLTPAFAFAFAMLTMVFVFTLVKFSGHSTKSLVLTGVAIGYLFSSLVSILKYVSDTKELPELVFWTMGSLAGITWEVLAIVFGVLAVCVIISLIISWDLNIMTFGREEAIALGVNYKRKQTIVFILTTILTATTVSFTGVIGFVGLVAPHITRMIIGNDFRYGIPVTCFLGSLLLLVSDTIARTVIAPTELPVGIVTSLIGVPFYIYLVLRRSKNV